MTSRKALGGKRLKKQKSIYRHYIKTLVVRMCALWKWDVQGAGLDY